MLGKLAILVLAVLVKAAHSEVSKIGALFGSPYNKDHSILGSILGPLLFGNSHRTRIKLPSSLYPNYVGGYRGSQW